MYNVMYGKFTGPSRNYCPRIISGTYCPRCIIYEFSSTCTWIIAHAASFMSYCQRWGIQRIIGRSNKSVVLRSSGCTLLVVSIYLVEFRLLSIVWWPMNHCRLSQFGMNYCPRIRFSELLSTTMELLCTRIWRVNLLAGTLRVIYPFIENVSGWQ